MFDVSNLINKREFIKKLNDKTLNLFDGKYSSLTEIPTEFPPEEHTHELVSSENVGFVDSQTVNVLKNGIKNVEPNVNYQWLGFSNESVVCLRGIIPYFVEKNNSGVSCQTIINSSSEETFNIDPFKHNVIELIEVKELSVVEIALEINELLGFCLWDYSNIDCVSEYFSKVDGSIVIPITFKIEVPLFDIDLCLVPRIQINNNYIRRIFQTDRFDFKLNSCCHLENMNHDIYVNSDMDSNTLLYVRPDAGYSLVNGNRYHLFVNERRLVTIQTLLDINPKNSVHTLHLLHVS